jgi:hypothetical protein
MKLNIALFLLAFIIVLITMYFNGDNFFRENSSLIEYIETKYGGDLAAMELSVINDKINKNFEKVADALARGTGQNMGFVIYNAPRCGHGDRNRARNGHCKKYHNSCVSDNGMETMACPGGLNLDTGQDCRCMKLTQRMPWLDPPSRPPNTKRFVKFNKI